MIRAQLIAELEFFMPRFFVFVSAIAGALSCLAGSAVALDQESIAVRRLKIAWQQPMLTQRIAKAACLAERGVDRNGHLTQLETAQNLFQMRLDGLIDGSKRIGISPPADKALIEKIADAGKLWQVFRSAIEVLIRAKKSDAATAASAAKLVAQNMSLLDATRTVVFAIESTTKVASTERDPALAGAILVARRQRTLSQKLAKEVCLIGAETQPALYRAHLLGTVALFESARADLERNLEGLALTPKHTAQIRTHDAAIGKTWDKLKALITPVQKGEKPGGDVLREVASLADKLLVQLNASLDAYERAQQLRMKQAK